MKSFLLIEVIDLWFLNPHLRDCFQQGDICGSLSNGLIPIERPFGHLGKKKQEKVLEEEEIQ